MQARAQLRELARPAGGKQRAGRRALEIADAAQGFAQRLAAAVGLEPGLDPVVARADGRRARAAARRARLARRRRPSGVRVSVERREQSPVAAAVAQVLEQLEMAARGAVEQEQVARAVAAQRAELRERGGLELGDGRDQRAPRRASSSARRASSPCGSAPTRSATARGSKSRVADPADLRARRQILLGVAGHDLARRRSIELGQSKRSRRSISVAANSAGRQVEVRNSVSPPVGEHRGQIVRARALEPVRVRDQPRRRPPR